MESVGNDNDELGRNFEIFLCKTPENKRYFNLNDGNNNLKQDRGMPLGDKDKLLRLKLQPLQLPSVCILSNVFRNSYGKHVDSMLQPVTKIPGLF